ncbi:M20/M25/M40 family metallo-hydrolase [bacterium]|nr:M20/M25/M40 family metallo-hydrolase [candidate division CSSED10-310 bacterium]
MSDRADSIETLIGQAANWLRELLRIDTSNPPGNEQPAAELLADILRGERIEPFLIHSGPRRTNLVARLPGEGAPLLLSGHLDVVPAASEDWSYPPFSGTLAEDCFWGRGALDMKGPLMVLLAAFIHLHRLGGRLRRPVILAAVADEEQGGRFGSAYLVDHHPDLVRAEYAVGEVGGFSTMVEGRRIYPIQVAEKGHGRLLLTFRGEPGHASLPNVDNALAAAGKAAATLAAQRLPYHRTLVAQRFIDRLANLLPWPRSLAIRALLNRALAPLILDRLGPAPLAASLTAMLHNTATPTIMHAGTAANVVPDKAALTIDARTLPGITQDQFIGELRDLLGDSFDCEVLQWMPPVEAPPDDPILDAMEAALRSEEPTARIVPYLLPGFSDAKHFTRLGAKWYGFIPLRLPDEMSFQPLIHGIDERLPRHALKFGVTVMSRFLSHFCMTADGHEEDEGAE